MQVIKCIKKEGFYIHENDDGAFNPENEIALIELENEFEYAFSLGCDKIYLKTTSYKMLYPEKHYNIAWDYINATKGNLTSIEKDFETVMKEDGLTVALGNVRMNRVNFEVKTHTNGRNCDVCVC